MNILRTMIDLGLGEHSCEKKKKFCFFSMNFMF
jgi:hypothetical protein